MRVFLFGKPGAVQTPGGLLVTVAADNAEEIVRSLSEATLLALSFPVSTALPHISPHECSGIRAQCKAPRGNHEAVSPCYYGAF